MPYSPSRRYKKAKYIRGHAPTPLRAQPPPLQGPPCACGCGQPTAVYHGRVSTFRPGHNAGFKGRRHSTLARDAIREKRAAQPNVSGIAPHGMSKTPTYRSWITMHWRCYDSRDASYPSYGARGITVCDRWNRKAGGSFLNFLADMGERPAGMTLDRINGDGNYEPANCRWATLREQAANRPADNGWQKRRAAAHP